MRPSKDKAYVSAYNKQYNIRLRIQNKRLKALRTQILEVDLEWSDSDIICKKCRMYREVADLTMGDFLDTIEPFIERHKNCK